MTRRPVARGVLLSLATALALLNLSVVAPKTATAMPAGSAARPAVPFTAAEASSQGKAGAETITMDGGDVIALTRPVLLRRADHLGKSWESLDVETLSAVPSTGMGAVFVEVSSASARGKGDVLVRPYGSTGAGSSVTSYKSIGGRGLGLVKAGTGGRIQLRSSGGSPVVSVRVVAWVPESAQLTVPAESPAERAVRVSSTTRRLKLAGVGGVPVTAAAVLVSVRATALKPGTLSVWTPGLAQPKYGEAFAGGTSRFLQVVTPAGDGTIALRTLRGKASAGVRVLGWTASGSTVTPRGAPTRLASVMPGAARVVTVAGTASIPARAQDTWLSVTAPLGASVTVWPNATGSGAPLHAWRSTGVAVSLLVPVPAGRKVSVKVKGTRAASAVVAHGWNGIIGGSKVTLVPKPGTYLLGNSDVESLEGTRMVLAATADKVAVGNHLLAQVRGLPYVLRVDSATPLAGGRQELQVSVAQASDALLDMKASYHGPVVAPSDVREPVPGLASASDSQHRRRAAAGAGLSVPLGGLTWSCQGTAGLPSFDASYTGDVNFDVSLSDRMVDFSMKGSLSTTITMSGDETFSCAAEVPGLAIPFAGMPAFALKFAGTARLSVSPVSGTSGNRLSFTTTERAYAAFYYDGGQPVIGKALDMDATDNSAMWSGGRGQFDLGIKAAVGPTPLGPVEIGPEASVTFGVSLQVGPPDASNDKDYPRQLAGQRCSDAGFTLFVEIGAQFTFAFFEVVLEPFRYDLPPKIFDRGPCIGYAGTITTHWKGSYPQGAAGCTAQSCPSRDWDHTIVRTMIPEPASFDPGYNIVIQPYTWSWTGKEIVEDDVPKTFDGSVTTHCVWTDTGSGSGTADWAQFKDLSDSWNAKSWQGWAPDSGSYVNSQVVGGAAEDMHEVVGDPDWCGGFSVSPASPPVLDANAPDGVVGALSIEKPTINTTFTFNPPFHPERAWTITFNLTQREFPR